MTVRNDERARGDALSAPQIGQPRVCSQHRIQVDSLHFRRDGAEQSCPGTFVSNSKFWLAYVRSAVLLPR